MSLEIKEKINNGKYAFVILHGYGADNNDLFPLNSYLGNQFDYFFPNGPMQIPTSPFTMGRAWYYIDLEGRVPGDPSLSNYIYDYEYEPIKKVAQTIVDYCEELKSKYEKVVIGGFSQGSMISLLCFLLKPELFSYVALFSSHHFASDKLSELIKSHSTDSPMIFQSHAHDDMVLPYVGAVKLKEDLGQAGLLEDFVDFYGGHSISPEVLQKLKELLDAKF